MRRLRHDQVVLPVLHDEHVSGIVVEEMYARVRQGRYRPVLDEVAGLDNRWLEFHHPDFGEVRVRKDSCRSAAAESDDEGVLRILVQRIGDEAEERFD